MPENLPEWVDRLGVAVAILVFIAIAIWKGGKWFGLSILLPMKERHFSFLDRMEATQQSHAACLIKLTEMQATTNERLDDVSDDLRQLRVELGVKRADPS